MEQQQLENLFNVCRVGYESMNFDLLVSSCYFEYNKHLFKRYSHINFKSNHNKYLISDLFGKWCSALISLNCDSPEIVQWRLNLIEQFPLLIELKNVISHGWTMHKPISLERAREIQLKMLLYMEEFIYLTQDLEKYNEKRKIMGRFEGVWSKKDEFIPPMSEWKQDMIEWLYRQGGEMYCKSEKLILRNYQRAEGEAGSSPSDLWSDNVV